VEDGGYDKYSKYASFDDDGADDDAFLYLVLLRYKVEV
jgi:hypothetical protein